jgi:hypothetical protein
LNGKFGQSRVIPLGTFESWFRVPPLAGEKISPKLARASLIFLVTEEISPETVLRTEYVLVYRMVICN